MILDDFFSQVQKSYAACNGFFNITKRTKVGIPERFNLVKNGPDIEARAMGARNMDVKKIGSLFYE